jgi:hypothetical protein
MYIQGKKLVSECGKEFKMPAPKMLKPPNDTESRRTFFIFYLL